MNIYLSKQRDTSSLQQYISDHHVVGPLSIPTAVKEMDTQTPNDPESTEESHGNATYKGQTLKLPITAATKATLKISYRSFQPPEMELKELNKKKERRLFEYLNRSRSQAKNKQNSELRKATSPLENNLVIPNIDYRNQDMKKDMSRSS